MSTDKYLSIFSHQMRAAIVHIAGYSCHSNKLITNRLTCHSYNTHLLFQLLAPASKHFETHVMAHMVCAMDCTFFIG